MKRIKLKGDHVILIDDEDYDKVMAHRWFAVQQRGHSYYVIANLRFEGKKTTIRLHRLIMDVLASPEWVVDHINGDTLDNRKANLRKCSQKENSRNKKKNRLKSGYKGVTKRGIRYRSRIAVDGKLLELGNFSTAEEAAIAYNNAALAYYGAFANLNEVLD